jgi:hypothetical protein
MKHLLLLTLLVLPQDDEKTIPARLKKGWSAVRAITLRGEASRPALADAARSSDADIAFYAKAALAELEPPPLPRTKGLRGSGQDATAALFAMHDLRFSGDDLPGQSLEIPDGLTFMEALDWVGAKLGLDFAASDKAEWNSVPSRNPHFAFGRFRARLRALRRTTEFPLDKPAVETLTLSGAIAIDPTFRLVPCHHAVTVIEAVDNTGAKLRQLAPGAEAWFRRGGQSVDPTVPFSVNLGGLDPKAATIDLLRLSTQVTIEKKRETFTFEKILDARGAHKASGPVTVTIKDVAMEGEETTVDLEIVATADVDFPEWGSVQMADASGGLYGFGGSLSHDGRTAKYRLRYSKVGALGPPESLTFSMTTETETRVLYLEFRDVPLN